VSRGENRRTASARRVSTRRSLPIRVAALVGVVIALGLPTSLGVRNPPALSPGGSSAAPLLLEPLAATLVGGPVSGTSSPTFWGVIAQTASRTGISSDPSIGAFLSSTPITWFEYTQHTDQCNITSNSLYSDGGVRVGGCGFDIGSLKTWCLSRGPDCHAILLLPGENNNSVEDANMANYIVNTLHFQPSYFAIGNEPELWTHYGKAWNQWRSSDRSTPTPREYAFDVHAAIGAVRAVDPSAKFVGIEADCECSPGWFSEVARIDGALISAIAYHGYPSTTGRTNVTPTQFFSALSSPRNLTTSYAKVRADIAGRCGRCDTLPIFVGEYNSGPGRGPSNLAGSWSGAVFLAASVVQAIRANVSLFSTFNLQNSGSGFTWSMMNDRNLIGYEGRLYADLFPHLQMGQFRNESVRTTVGNVWAVVTFEQGRHTLLVVNANATRPIALSLNHAISVGAGTTPTVYEWSVGLYVPLVTTGALAPSYVIPSQGILLIDYAN
jgi:hypothetical protein